MNNHGDILSSTMSALDIKITIEEMEECISGAWANKIYQIENIFLLKVNISDSDIDKNLVIEPGKRIHLTSKKFNTPKKPPSFAMLLRKHLSNKRIKALNQPDFERVIEIVFEGNNSKKLICELFGEGNLILCEGDGEIIQPFRFRDWQDRKIKPGKKYSLPPKKGKSPEKISKSDLEEFISESPDVVRGLARNLAIGGELSEEICEVSSIDQDKNFEELNDEDIEDLYSGIEQVLNENISPRILYREEGGMEVIPFNFETKEGSDFELFDSFNEALDEFYHQLESRQVDKKDSEEDTENIESLKNRLSNQKENLKKLRKDSEKLKEKADLISQKHQEVDLLINKVNRIRESEGWEKVENLAEKENEELSDSQMKIVEVDRNNGILKINESDEIIALDIRKNSFDNASDFYEKSKKKKKKIEGANEAIKETKKEIDELRKETTEKTRDKITEKIREKNWFEKFKWFFTSQNILTIAGKDRKTNQEIVNKHMENRDKYFHADLKGAPHVVLKSEGKEISDKTIKEAAIFSAIHSKAWKKGLANVDVYHVDPDQVSEEAPSGEYVPSGGFVIKGERKFLKVPLEAGVGFVDYEGEKIPMCGPISSVKHHSDISVKIKPGQTKKSDLVKKIKKKLEDRSKIEVDLDYLMGILPPGPGMVLE